jgi:hypothetical protein
MIEFSIHQVNTQKKKPRLGLYLFFIGVYYRPRQLKSMTCLLGNTESRTVYHQFQLNHLKFKTLWILRIVIIKNIWKIIFFIPPYDDQPYFSHYTDNKLPQAPSTTETKGLFNLFPLSLCSDQVVQSSSSTSSFRYRKKKKKKKKKIE